MQTALEAKSLAERAHQKMESHEELCTERWTQSRVLMEKLEEGQGAIIKGVWGVVIAVTGWALVTLYHGLSVAPH